MTLRRIDRRRADATAAAKEADRILALRLSIKRRRKQIDEREQVEREIQETIETLRARDCHLCPADFAEAHHVWFSLLDTCRLLLMQDRAALVEMEAFRDEARKERAA